MVRAHFFEGEVHAAFQLAKVFFNMRRLDEAMSHHLLALRLPEEENTPRAYVHNDLGNALSDAELVAHLRAQLQRGQAVMRALVMECLAEREAKQELEFQLTQLRARVE